VDEQVCPHRVLDYLRARARIDGEDRNGIRPSDAEAHAFEAMVEQERGDLCPSYHVRLAGDELVPAKALPQPAFCARDRQVKVASQRSKRLGCGVDGKRSFGKGCEGGEKGSQPADVVEVAVADEHVAHGFERDASGLEATEQYGAAGGIDQHRLVTRERHGHTGLSPLRVQGVTGPEEG
jgi:hypothetical protein